MAECQKCSESGASRNLYPALAVAAIAGVAITYLFVRKTRTTGEPMAVDKVVSICNSAADRLEAFASRAIAG